MLYNIKDTLTKKLKKNKITYWFKNKIFKIWTFKNISLDHK